MFVDRNAAKRQRNSRCCVCCVALTLAVMSLQAIYDKRSGRPMLSGSDLNVYTTDTVWDQVTAKGPLVARRHPAGVSPVQITLTLSEVFHIYSRCRSVRVSTQYFSANHGPL